MLAPTFRRIRHPGNFAYVFGLDRHARASIAAAVDQQPYPRGSALHDAGPAERKAGPGV